MVLREQSVSPIENLRGSLAAARHFERIGALQKKLFDVSISPNIIRRTHRARD
jgi:hypothetical protein